MWRAFEIGRVEDFLAWHREKNRDTISGLANLFKAKLANT
jgi:hypothetical protein